MDTPSPTRRQLLDPLEGPYLTISDAAFASGLTPKCLRRYEADGLLNPERAVNGTRLYTIDDLTVAQQIYQSRSERHGMNRRPLPKL